VLGNHTYSHFRPDRWREFAADVRRGEAVLRLLRPPPIPFRLPYGIQRVAGSFPLGSTGEEITRCRVIASMGLTHQHWTRTSRLDALRRRRAGVGREDGGAREPLPGQRLDAVLDLHDSAPARASLRAPRDRRGREAVPAGGPPGGWKSFTVRSSDRLRRGSAATPSARACQVAHVEVASDIAVDEDMETDVQCGRRRDTIRFRPARSARPAYVPNWSRAAASSRRAG